MSYVKGKIKRIIFNNNESGFSVALFKVLETDEQVLKEKINKTITITGVFTDINIDLSITLYGNYILNERFGMQYKVDKYEIDVPKTTDSIIEFLSSKFIDGCGERTAKKIVEIFGENTLDIIRDNKDNLLQVEGLSEAKIEKIYNSLMEFNKSSDTIIKLQNLGFNIEECSKIVNHFKSNLSGILFDDFYELIKFQMEKEQL